MRRSPVFITPRRALVFTIVLAAGLFAVLVPFRSASVDVSEDEISRETVRSPKDLTYRSEVLTQRRRDEAAASIQPTLVFDANAQARQLQRLEEVLLAISTVRGARFQDATQRSAQLTSIQGLQLSPRAAVLALAFTDEEWAAVQREARVALAETLNDPIKPDGVTRAREDLNQRVQARLSEGVGLLVLEIVGALIGPNQVVDEAATQRARDQARAAVAPVIVNVVRGEVIVRAGEAADAAVIEKLQQLGLHRDDLPAGDIGAAAVVALIAAAMLGVSLLVTGTMSVTSVRQLALLGLAVVAAAGMARVALPEFLPDEDRLYLSYMLPFAAVPVVVAALLGTPIAIVVAALVAILAGFAAFSQPVASQVAQSRPLDVVVLTTTLLFAGLTGAFVAQAAERRDRMLAAGAAIAAMTLLSLSAFWLMDPGGRSDDVPWILGASVAAGAGSGLVATGALVFVAGPFGFMTRLRLMELTQLDQPLLRRLREEAPGTFHHSIILSHLTERAAEAIGADALLVQVGSYYHDIGKTLHREYFIENQEPGANPHDELEPDRSAAIIIEHVRGGMDLARRHGIPDPVLAFIPEHHGTRPVSYFYRKASESDPAVDDGGFRYPGPKPQSRETAIVMLGDSVEAVVRSSSDRSPERIDALVDGIIAERLGEGELDESDLTLRDIAAIAASFKETLHGVYHPRIEYPAPTTAEQQRAAEAARVLGGLPMPMDGITVPGVER